MTARLHEQGTGGDFLKIKANSLEKSCGQEGNCPGKPLPQNGNRFSRINRPKSRTLFNGVSALKGKKENRPGGLPCLRLEPEKRLCPIFDDVTIATFPVAPPEEMGFRVLDDFCEEHIQ